MPLTGEYSIVVLMPVYNDWPACQRLLERLDAVMDRHELRANVLLVDDGSAERPPAEFAYDFRALNRVDVMTLKRNVGHQRAICIGLAHLDAYAKADVVVIMDADGEDDPADVPRLLEHCHSTGASKIVFAERTRRSESLVFRVCYLLYCSLHWLLTGHRVRVGNFSIVPRRLVSSLVVVPALWSHYAAAVFESRLPYCSIPTRRAKRLDSSSRMNFLSLVIHGLTAISVFSERVGVRLLLACAACSAALLAGILVVVGVRLFTTLAIPGWATYAAGVLVILLLQCLMFALLFCFMILNSRDRFNFVPARDFSYYIAEERTLFAFRRTMSGQGSA